MYDARQEPNEFVADSLEEARSKAAEFFGTEASALHIVVPAVGEIFGAEGAREGPVEDPRHRDVGRVVGDDDARERREQAPLRQHRRGGESGRPRPEGLFGPAHEAAGHEEGPALDVDRPQERGERPRREHEPRGRVPEHGLRHTDDDEAAGAELRECQSRRLRGRHERRERRRRQHDRYTAQRREGRKARHRTSPAMESYRACPTVGRSRAAGEWNSRAVPPYRPLASTLPGVGSLMLE